MDMMNACCGARHESQLDGYSEIINSKNIVKFSYGGRGYSLSASINDNKLSISTTGGDSYRRDGKYFIVRFESEDMSLLEELQTIIDKHNVSRLNGHCVHVDGLPGGIGDTFEVEYDSGEKIYKYSNQYHTVGDEASNEFYEAFHKYVIKHGYDFTSSGSNVQLYDDATVDYLQGTWNGKHFGSEISVTITGNNIKISVDGKIVDDTKYVIYEGDVVKNQLKEDKEPTSSFDYEYFNGLSKLKKKNYFTMTAYFLEESYSTCDLMNFNKEK